jgi:hypothetical protein
MPGYPIRTPWDHSSVDNSPRPIAASHVLHRLLVPRHPPSALDNLTTKILASTMHFSTNNQPTTPTPHQTRPGKQTQRSAHHARRYERPGRAWQPPPPPPPRGPRRRRSLKQQPQGLFPQDPTGCPTPTPRHTHQPVPTPQGVCTRTGRCRTPTPPVSPPIEHPRRPPGRPGDSTPPGPGRNGAPNRSCSLERR